jgi:hypothetical protein
MINVKSDVRMGEEAVMAYQRILSWRTDRKNLSR